MDCIVPGPSVRSFCAAIGSLSRVGKDLLWEFDAVDGLTLRALSDSKAVFASFHYEPAFFQRCTSRLIHATDVQHRHRKRKHHSHHDDDGKNEDGKNYHDEENNHHSSPSENNDQRTWCVRVAMKSLVPIIRPRKDVVSLRLTSEGDHQRLAFEFQIRDNAHTTTFIQHQVGTALAQSVAAVTHMDKASEIVLSPTVLLTLLEPLKRSAEVALLVSERHRLLSTVSFAHEDIIMNPNTSTSARTRTRTRTRTTTSTTSSNAENDNMNTAITNKNATLKTETSIGYDELMEIHYVSIPQEVDSSETSTSIPPPQDLKEQCVLVFTLKEFKAFIAFCAAQGNSSYGDSMMATSPSSLSSLNVITIQFYWGGRPMVVTAQSNSFSANLVMATLDHQLLGKSVTTMNTTTAAAAAAATENR